jgi:hypothetical protein
MINIPCILAFVGVEEGNQTRDEKSRYCGIFTALEKKGRKDLNVTVSFAEVK